MQDTLDIYVSPPTFSLAPQLPPHFFHSRIATGRKLLRELKYVAPSRLQPAEI